MRRKKQTSRARADIYQEVTAQIIADLEQGIVPWVKPWKNLQTGGPCGLPMNPTTGNTYSGINILLLWIAGGESGHASQSWMTYRQASQIGGQVRKGEKATQIVKVGSWSPNDEKQRAQEAGEDAATRSYLKRFSVFNVSQIEGLPDEFYPVPVDPELLAPANPVPAIEQLLKDTGADFRIGGNDAFFVPSADFIQVPPQSAYSDPIEYYVTCLHELTHWSGAKTRLDRNFKSTDGSKDYAREELVAEMGAAFLCAHFGVKPVLRHAEYIGHWLKVLQGDNRAIIAAASAASKAVEFILATQTPEAGDVTKSSKLETRQPVGASA